MRHLFFPIEFFVGLVKIMKLKAASNYNIDFISCTEVIDFVVNYKYNRKYKRKQIFRRRLIEDDYQINIQSHYYILIKLKDSYAAF